jgi:hypothetical protein
MLRREPFTPLRLETRLLGDFFVEFLLHLSGPTHATARRGNLSVDTMEPENTENNTRYASDGAQQRFLDFDAVHFREPVLES